ncbi:WD40-repeat-containing domain protein, partial [Thamnocephalis sphaerospora]
TLVGHTNKVLACAFSASNRWLASVGHDRKVIIWSANNGQLLYDLPGHSNQVTSVRFSPDARDLLATASYDKSVRIWRGLGAGTAPECAIVFSGHTHSVTALDWSPDGAYLVTASEDAVCVWDAAT